MTKNELIEGISSYDGGILAASGRLARMTKVELSVMLAEFENPTAKVLAFSPVDRKKSKRGRPVRVLSGMVAMVAAWEELEVGATYPLPDYEGGNDHAPLSNARHHFKKYAAPAGILAGIHYTIEGDDRYGATITKK